MSTRKFSHAIRLATAVAAISLGSATFVSAQYTPTTIFTFAPAQGCVQTPTSVAFDTAGNLFGTANGAGCSNIFELSPSSSGWTETLHLSLFHYGAQLSPGVAFDSSGNFYFTTLTGENGWQCAINCGAVFQEGAAIHLATVPDGYHPNPLIIDANGNLYGTTQAGGSSDPNSMGVVYKLALDRNAGRWIETILHRFTGGNDGGVPVAALVMDANGVLYGTASQGGLYGFGTVYTLTPNSDGRYTFAWVHAFTGGARGGNPMSPLLIDASGNLYGTTIHGGNRAMCPANNGCGLAFELQKTATGYEEIVILQMQPTRAGEYPVAGLVADAAGNLYGSTPSGNGIAGTVFKLTRGEFGWAYTVILTGNSDLGGFGPLTIDSAGNLYGPASGSKIFELSPPTP